jgi:hypothetical protein
LEFGSVEFKLSQTENKPPGAGLRASEAEEKRKKFTILEYMKFPKA